MKIIEFNPKAKEDNSTEYREPYLKVINPKDLEDTLNILEKSISPTKKTKIDTRSKIDKIIDKALVIATLAGSLAIIWFLRDTLGIKDITTANIDDIKNMLSNVDTNMLLTSTMNKIGRIR